MVDPPLPADHRAGYVAVVGRPNVGKSTLINAFLGQSVAAVSPKPQTTRGRQLGVLTLPEAQVIFVDTPGIHRPYHKLGEQMNQTAQEALEDADVILAIFDLTEPPGEDDERVVERIQSLSSTTPVITALNKLDAVPPDRVQERLEAYEALIPDAVISPAISATQGTNRDLLLSRLLSHLPQGPRYYPEDQLTDLYERDIAADLIRAAAMQLLRDEVPYGIAVRIDQYLERDSGGARIEATLLVDKESHKGIVIGKGGSMIREIGVLARRQIEEMSGRKVYLELRVKALPGWTNDERLLKRMGATQTGNATG